MAPIVAAMIVAIMPPPSRRPSVGNSQLAMKAPTMPMTISPRSKASSLYDLAGKPAGSKADQQDNQ